MGLKSPEALLYGSLEKGELKTGRLGDVSMVYSLGRGFDEGVSSTVVLGDVDRADLDQLLDLITDHRES